MSDEFYVGYLPSAPPSTARHVRRVVGLLAIGLLGTAAVVAASQSPRTPGLFEFGTVRTFEGILWESPIPMLEITGRDAADPESGGEARLVLVGLGKFGLPEFARGHHGARVRFAGTLVVHRNLSMVELNDSDSFEVLSPATATQGRQMLAAPRSLGSVSLTGELVDTKCYFGVMRPATGKVHRACAIRCLSGGVPPGLLVRDGGDGASVILLAGRNGEPLDYDVEWAALEVTAKGSLEMHGELPVLRVETLELDR